MNRKHLNSQQGVSLVEILIAMVIGVFLMAGVIKLFINSKETYRTQEALSRLQENGRFALEFLVRDIRMADFLGCLKDGLDSAAVTNNLNPGGTGYTAGIHDFTVGLEGTEGAAGANAALDAPDTITIRGADTRFFSVATGTTVGPTISGIALPSGLQNDDIVLIADCARGDIFQKTGNPGSLASLSTTYDDKAKLYNFATTVFSIQNGTGGLPGLFRQINDAPAVELVEGIENMQILYGQDTDTPQDGTANFYVPAGTVGLDMNQVVSVRISILARTITDAINLTRQPIPFTYNGATTTPNDRQIRKVFTTTIALRNRLD